MLIFILEISSLPRCNSDNRLEKHEIGHTNERSPVVTQATEVEMKMERSRKVKKGKEMNYF